MANTRIVWSEPLDKILRYGQSLTFFDKSVVGSSVIYDDLGQRLNKEGLSGVLTQLTGLLRERRPALVVIDSFKALRAYAPDDGVFRRFLHELAGQLTAMPITSFWVGEYDDTETTEAPEFAVAVAIVSLGFDRIAEREARVLQVLKLRGSGFVSGKHAYRLSQEGVEVFPRLADPEEVESYDLTVDRLTTTSGVGLLDETLSDGFCRGSSTLIAGPSGSGKTLLALHFAFSGAQLGERCLFATLQENPAQLERILSGFSWSPVRGGQSSISTCSDVTFASVGVLSRLVYTGGCCRSARFHAPSPVPRPRGAEPMRVFLKESVDVSRPLEAIWERFVGEPDWFSRFATEAEEDGEALYRRVSLDYSCDSGMRLPISA